jgi:hypothetical protein
MDEMAIDIEKGGPVFGLMHQMIVPDLVVQRPRLCHEARILQSRAMGRYLAVFQPSR